MKWEPSSGRVSQACGTRWHAFGVSCHVILGQRPTEREALLWCVSISPACYGRLMSVFPSHESHMAPVIPQETNKNPKNVIRKQQACARCRPPRSSAPLRSLSFSPPKLTSFFMHNWNTNDYPISIHRQAPGCRLPLRCPCVNILSHFSHFASLSQPSFNSRLNTPIN